MRFSHKLQDKQWCVHSRDQLAAYISFPPIKYRKVNDARVTSGFTEIYYAQSHTHPALDLLKSLWYPSGVKVIPFHLLQTHFTRTSLAWWFMDDGHLRMVNDQPSKIILSTESFTQLELKHLCSLLKEKFLLEFKIDRAKRLVIYNKMQIHYFLKLVKPYLVKCMYRKTFLKSPISNAMTPKRTTIYLPIKLTSPTKEIHEALSSLKGKIEILSDETKYVDLYCCALKNLDMKKQTNFSYQVSLQPQLIVEISKCQAITGMRVSEIVHWCFIK